MATSLMIKGVTGGYIVHQIWPAGGEDAVFAVGAEKSMLYDILRRLTQPDTPLEEMLGESLVSQWMDELDDIDTKETDAS